MSNDVCPRCGAGKLDFNEPDTPVFNGSRCDCGWRKIDKARLAKALRAEAHERCDQCIFSGDPTLNGGYHIKLTMTVNECRSLILWLEE